ncbi:MAG: short chain dehydrogenase family protein 44 [Variovorax sp.]|nr:short chain dehydrogenase family protein 44 [Variovorax sp.]
MSNVVLVAGASGLVGTAAVDAFLDAGWEVIALSRRKPEVFSERPFTHISVDLRERAACEAAFAGLSGVTHLVYTAVYEMPGLVAGWQDRRQMDINLGMLRNLMEPLSRASRIEHVTLLQGTKAYGVHIHAIPVPARERQPRDDHPNFYWLQEDYIRELSARSGMGWTILRPTVVLGPNVGVVMNILPVVGVYAALCREEGLPFGFPGDMPYVREAVDTRLIGRAAVWAAHAPAARCEHFNLTNGEAFSWHDLWPAMAECLGMQPAPDRSVSMAQYLPSRADLWDRVVRREGLRRLRMEQLLGESHHYADFGFGWGLKQTPPPAFVSTVKVKQAGFTDTFDTELAARHWLNVLMDRRILPRP